MTFIANFIDQSLLFPCIPMGELLFSYAKTVQERMFLFIANDHHSQGLFPNSSDLTLTYFPRSHRPFKSGFVKMDLRHKSYATTNQAICYALLLASIGSKNLQ